MRFGTSIFWWNSQLFLSFQVFLSHFFIAQFGTSLALSMIRSLHIQQYEHCPRIVYYYSLRTTTFVTVTPDPFATPNPKKARGRRHDCLLKVVEAHPYQHLEVSHRMRPDDHHFSSAKSGSAL
jgi:hypothetical protein